MAQTVILQLDPYGCINRDWLPKPLFDDFVPHIYLFDCDGETYVEIHLPNVNDRVVERVRRAFRAYLDARDPKEGAKVFVRRVKRLLREMGYKPMVRIFDVEELWTEIRIEIESKAW